MDQTPDIIMKTAPPPTLPCRIFRLVFDNVSEKTSGSLHNLNSQSKEPTHLINISAPQRNNLIRVFVRLCLWNQVVHLHCAIGLLPLARCCSASNVSHNVAWNKCEAEASHNWTYTSPHIFLSSDCSPKSHLSKTQFGPFETSSEEVSISNSPWIIQRTTCEKTNGPVKFDNSLRDAKLRGLQAQFLPTSICSTKLEASR